jgi:hypothetical protein
MDNIDEPTVTEDVAPVSTFSTEPLKVEYYNIRQALEFVMKNSGKTRANARFASQIVDGSGVEFFDESGILATARARFTNQLSPVEATGDLVLKVYISDLAVRTPEATVSEDPNLQPD